MTRLANTLKQYSAYSACFLALHKGADSQVVYVDIDPDIVLNEGGQAAELDLDQNGSIDFWFHNNSFTFYSEYDSSYRIMQNILIGPEIDENYIAGTPDQYGTGYGGVYTRYYPYALDINARIDTNLNFDNYELQVLALMSIRTDEGDYIANDGFWFIDLGVSTLDHYLGIKFKSGEIVNSYGWIRCDVKDNGRTLIIKDYAYETTPEYPIIAGDTVHYVEVIDAIPSEPVYVYSFNETLYVNLKDSAKAMVTIASISGQTIWKYETTDVNSTVDLTNVANGMYMVTVEYKNKVYTTKIAIH